MLRTGVMLLVESVGRAALHQVFARFSLDCLQVDDGAVIPGTYWGEPEAGLVGNTLYLRGDTPLHSALHEGAHFICMDAARRCVLDTDAGGDDAEEVAVCYLQTALAPLVPNYDCAQLFADMDAWGYSFRLGSARRWYLEDAEDAVSWLQQHGILQPNGKLALARATGS